MPQNAQLLQLLIDQIADYALVMTDVDRRVIVWNTGAERLLGWREDEILGQLSDVFFTQEDRAANAPEQETTTAREQGRAVDERWYVRKDGSRFWGSGLLFPVRDGDLRGYVKVFRDLTERRREQWELKDARLRLDAALDAAEIGTWTWDIAENKVYADRNLARFFSVSPEDAQGGPIEQYLRAVHPDDLVRVQSEIAEASASGKRYDVKYRLVMPDKSLCYVAARGKVEGDAEGRSAQLNGIVIDITAQQQAESARAEALAQAERDRLLLDAFLESLPAGVVIAEPNGRVVRVNAAFARLWGGNPPMSPDVEGYREYIGYWADTGRLVEVEEWAMARALRGETCPGDLVEIERFDGGGRRVIINSAAPVRDSQGNIVAGIVAELDVTEQVRAQETLKRNQREIETLNARLTRAMRETHHRVKNNLQVIAGLIEIQESDDVVSPAMQRIKQHVRALALLHDLLTQSVKDGAEGTHVPANEVIVRLLTMLQATSGSRRIEADVDEVALAVRNAAALALLINECVSNAIKHSRGNVQVILRAENGLARLEVRDDGDGFPSGFDPRQAANTGLELIDSAARWDLRGEVRYENNADGGGRVVVTFPLDNESEILREESPV